MRRFLATLLACMLLACAPAFAQQLAAIPALDGPVIDTTNTLQPAQVTTLDAQARALQKRKGSQLQILDGAHDAARNDRAVHRARVRAVQAGAQGRGRRRADRRGEGRPRVRIEPGYGLEGAIPTRSPTA
jgi:uncharacterized protein